MKKNILFLFVLQFILGCNGEPLMYPDPSIQKLNQSFEVKVGQKVSIDGEQISFKFESVPEDSRCPMDAECVWAGNAKVILSFINGKDSLNTYLKPREINYGNYKIGLVSVSPLRRIQESIPKDAYVAKLIVSKK